MNRVIPFIKKEAVLCISGVLAILSSLLVKPDLHYFSYLDYRVLALLFCLMGIMAGFQSLGFFEKLGHALLIKTKNIRQLASTLIFLCFFSSMLITNDVALITFVPFTIMILAMAHQEKYLIRVIVLQTIAANLGSMLTPIGNPQNLYLYSISAMTLSNFIGTMFPYVAASFFLLLLFLFSLKNTPISLSEMKQDEPPLSRKYFACYSALFFLCIGTVLHLLSWQLMLIIVLIGLVFCDKTLLTKIDYSLLLTFVFFFIFIGNVERIPAVNNALSAVLLGNELTAAILASQIISNVPAALLLSGFDVAYHPLLIGVNIGGLGTLIASLASLISYKFYVNHNASGKGNYLIQFTFLNLCFLLPLVVLAVLLG